MILMKGFKLTLEQWLGATFAVLLFFAILASTVSVGKPELVKVKIIETNGALSRGLFGNRFGSTLVELPDGRRKLVNGKWGKEGETITVKLIGGRIEP